MSEPFKWDWEKEIDRLRATIAAQAERIRELEGALAEGAYAKFEEYIERIAALTAERDDLLQFKAWAEPQITNCGEHITERDALREQLRKHDEWFSNNAVNLAVHRIGGFSFDSPPHPHSKP